MKNMQFGKLKLEIHDDRRQMGSAAALHGVSIINRIIAEKGEVNVVFAAAPSQVELYEGILASDIDFSKIRCFHMDEYIGLAEDASQRFGNYLDEHLFSKAPWKAVHVIKGYAKDPQQECHRYAQLLKQFPPDVIFHGIGENGHLAFNDPPVANFQDTETVKIVHMDEVCRMQQVHDGCFESIEQVPKMAISLTIPILTAMANFLVVTVPGPTKIDAIYHTVTDKIDERCPATILRRHNNVRLFIDKEAAFRLM